MKRLIVNEGASVRQRLLNEAKRRGESFDYLVSLYARERFLARLAESPYRNRLILKGATVLSLWIEAHRTTRDLDFLGSGRFAPDDAIGVVQEIAVLRIAGDGVTFHAAGAVAEPIREADEYRGVRVHLSAALDTVRIRLQIDIAVGDVVTPAPAMAILPAILNEFSSPRLRVYPPESVVAEKLHVLVRFGIANSRMKDFFDLYALARGCSFEQQLLTRAVARTFERRKTPLPDEPFALTSDFYADRAKQTQWRAFLGKSNADAPDDFTAVGRVLRAFLMPVVAAARSGEPRPRRWRGRRWRTD